MAFRYMLAPMEDVTDQAFRTLCYRYGADVTFTEMARLDGLAARNKATWNRFIPQDETPTIYQFAGAKEQSLNKFLALFEPPKGFEGFNLNLGCPSPDLIKIGIGCAMMKRVSRVQSIVGILKDRGYPVSLKMRLGLNGFEKSKKSYLNLINGVDADFYVVHARIGSDTYEDKADFSVYPECVATGKPIIANGDIWKHEQVAELKAMGLSGAMIGRAAVVDPAIFDHLKGKQAPDFAQLKEEYLALCKRFAAPEKFAKKVLKHLGEHPRDALTVPARV